MSSESAMTAPIALMIVTYLIMFIASYGALRAITKIEHHERREWLVILVAVFWPLSIPSLVLGFMIYDLFNRGGK